MKRILLIAVLISLSAVLSTAGYGSVDDNSNSFKIQAGGEWMYGYTLYEIGGTVQDYTGGNTWTQPFPTSELKYPVNIFLATLKADWSFHDRFEIELTVKQSVSSNYGLVEDSDWWILSGNPNTLDVYSTSDASLEFSSIDALFMIKLFSRSGFSLSVGPGFLFQYFYYDISNLDQTYPSGYYSETNVSGQIGTYQLEEYIFYAGFKLKYYTDFINIQLLLGLSPAVSSDTDEHLLRSLELDGSGTGLGALARLDIAMYFTENFFLDLKGGFIYITTKGTQYQYTSGDTASIDYSHESMQATAGLDIGFAF